MSIRPPHIKQPVLRADGTMTPEWYRWASDVTALANAGGGGGGGITTEDAVDAVAAAFAAGSHTGITVSYNDAGNSLSLAAAAATAYTDEMAQDAIAAMLAAGTHTAITVTYNDAGNALSLSGSTQYTDEMAQDAAAAMITGGTHSGITTAYVDASNVMNLTVTGGGGGSAEAASISAAAVAWWEFEENDGTSLFLDAVGSNDLTPRNGAGTITTATASSDTSPLLSRHFNPDASSDVTAYLPSSFRFTNTDFSYGGWIKTIGSSAASARFLIGNAGATGTDFQSYIFIENDDLIKVRFTTDGTIGGATIASASQALSPSAWLLVIATLDRTNDQIVIRSKVVGDSVITKATVAFAGALNTASGSANFTINDGLSSGTTYFSGSRNGVTQCSQAFILDSAITDDEFNYIFNGGLGKTLAVIQSEA